MKQIIQLLTQKWNSLKTWQKILLFIPFILIGMLYIFFVILKPSSSTINSKILDDHKRVSDKRTELIREKEEKLKEKQNKIDKKIKKNIREVEENEKQINNIIKEIDNADGDINKLVDIHKSINTRK